MIIDTICNEGGKKIKEEVIRRSNKNENRKLNMMMKGSIKSKVIQDINNRSGKRIIEVMNK